MSFEDGLATDNNNTAGSYSGTVYGGCINGNRPGKSNANSLSSDNTVISEKYIEMPAFTVPVVNNGTQFAFWMIEQSLDIVTMDPYFMYLLIVGITFTLYSMAIKAIQHLQ
jgi:hypothetical protein